MAMQPPADSLQAFEKRAFALYFVNDIHYPYISITLVSLVAVWLMYGHVPTWHIAIWFIAGSCTSSQRWLRVAATPPCYGALRYRLFF